MSTQVDQEPILELDGEKYIISELSDEAKVIIGRLQINEDELVKAQIVVERLMLSKEAYTSRLKAAVKAEPESEPEEAVTS